MSRGEYRSAVSSVRGVRPENEDAVVDARLPDGRHLVAIADGMGGHRSGAVASALAVQVVCRELRAGARLGEAVRAANAEVHREAGRNAERHGMGTTLVALLRTGAHYEIANVGDSRAYWVDRDGVRQITVDHSFAAEAARSGLMSPEQIARSPWRNALTRSLGTEATVQVDLFGPLPALEPPHLVLLCSDGLYRYLPEAEMRDPLLGAGEPQAAARLLAELSLRNRSDDNVSVAVVDLGGLLGAPVQGGARAAATRPPPVQVASAKWERPVPSPIPLRLPRWLRRQIATAVSDESMFLLCAGMLILWLTLRLLAD